MNRHLRVTLFWIGALAALILTLAVLRQILLPFVVGMALAYALDPVVEWLSKRGMRRTPATLIVLVLIVLALAAIFVLVVPALVSQTIDFLQNLPKLITQLQGLLTPLLDSEWGRFLGIDVDSLHTTLSGFFTNSADLLQTLLASVITGGRTVVDIASLFLVTPFVVFYLLRDWDRMIAWVDNLLPRDHAEEIRRLASAIDGKVAAFVRGQMLSGFALGVFYAVGLVAVGLNYGLLVGIVSGILSFIPYAGFTIGFVTSIAIAVVQFNSDWIWIAAVVVVFMLGQVFEGYFLQPYLIGTRVGLHPVWLLFSLFAFGALFGFLGVLLAIPAAAAVGVLLQFGIERYRGSTLYRGADAPADNAD